MPWTPMNLRAKFDAASCILGGEICNRTNTQTNKQTDRQTDKQKHANSKRHIYTLPIGMCG